MPGEETAFHLFETDRPEAVERTLRDAGLEADRISHFACSTGDLTWTATLQG